MNETKEYYIPVILGTAREGRLSEGVAKFVLSEFKKREGIKTELIDVKDFLIDHTIPGWDDDPRTKKWRDIALRADGFIIVTPEYNRGYPGELKLLLDSAYNEYNRKPVGLAGVSDGRFGGASAVELIKPTLAELGLVVMRGAVRFSNVAELFDDAGALKEPDYFVKSLSRLFDSLIWYTRALKTAREQGK